MNIIIATMTYTENSAVSNDVSAMHNILGAEHNCKVYAERVFARNAQFVKEKELKKLLRDESSLIIYHHSVYWEKGEKLLENARCRIVFRYHNITPPHFFERYSETYRSACEQGREQTGRLIDKFPGAMWLCDSRYNAGELDGVPDEQIFICPPFNNTELWAGIEPDAALLGRLRESDDINLLFVGRVVPNKGYSFLIDVLYCYVSNFGSKVKLRLIGDIKNSPKEYADELYHKIKLLGLTDNVEFTGEVSDSGLIAYYTGSDFFVSGSEHEGFFVPGIEAQYMKLPVIARACGAVPETLGDNQVLLGDDPAQYAAAIYLLQGNSGYCDYLRTAGFENFSKRFSLQKITEVFLEFLKKIK